jgi:hypothetical protein
MVTFTVGNVVPFPFSYQLDGLFNRRERAD